MFCPILRVDGFSNTQRKISSIRCLPSVSRGIATYQASCSRSAMLNPTIWADIASVPVVSVSKQKKSLVAILWANDSASFSVSMR